MRSLVLFLLLTLGLASCQVAENDRVDCHPDPDVSQENCQARNCIYDDSPSPDSHVPWCYYPQDFGYTVNGNIQDTPLGFKVEISKSGSASFVPDEFLLASIDFEFQTESRLRVKIQPNEARYEVPLEDFDPVSSKPSSTLYDVETEMDPVFSFRVVRKSTGEVLFDSSLGGLTIADQFLQVAGKLPSSRVYGLGEHEDMTMKHEMNWEVLAMFATDRSPEGDEALYGTHPVYTVVEDADGNTHSVLFLNSNAQEVQLTPSPGIVYRTIGGVIDMYFFLGPTPEETTQQYTKMVGRQSLPAYWNLGFHLCRWGYDNLDNMIAAYERTADANVPQEVQWADIDFMDRKLDFTYDKDLFAGLPDFINQLHDNDQRFVIIADPGVPTGEPSGSYPPFEDGIEKGVWVMDGSTGEPLLGNVWPENPVHFPDFTNPNTHTWWTESMQFWRDQIAFDGLWIDMNEPANFVDGAIDGCDMSDKRNSPPYTPKVHNGDILTKTVCMDAQHEGGSHYDTHSMYGWWESRATQKTIREISGGERGLVLSRSTFVGSGHYAAHWLGDNFSTWENMRAAIIGILQFNTFGIPLVGADICGFNGVTTEEMCLRWHQVGAFYPFSRNHNTIGMPDQDPGMWPSVATATRTALLTRYSLLPYLYTLFYQHQETGSTVARALWQQFPTDTQASDISEQFLWGSGLLVSPVLHEGVTAVNAYFPKGRWFDFRTGEEISAAGEESIALDAPLDGEIPLHIRGGEILPMQEPKMTTTEGRQEQFEMLVALDESGSAIGDLYWDDGISAEIQENTFVTFRADPFGSFLALSTEVKSSSFSSTPTVSKFILYGLDFPASLSSLDGCTVSDDGNGRVEIECAAGIDINTPFEMIVS